MPTTETVSIIKIEIDETIINKSIQNVAQLTNEIDKLKTIQVAARKDGKELTAEYIERNALIAALTKEQRQNNEVLKQANTIALSAVGSNEELRAQLSLLTKQYNGLSKEERENTDAGVKLKNNIKGISDELKKNEGAVGDNRRSVGSYKEAMTGVLDTLKKSGGSFGTAISGVQGFNAALSANPLGAVVQLLKALFDALSGNAEVADFLTRATAGVSKVFKFLTDTVVNLIKPLKAVFENPKQAIIDLIDLIKNNLVNRFKAFGVIVDAIANRDMKALTNGLLQLGTGVENSVDKLQAFGKALTDAGEEGFTAAKKIDEFTENQAKFDRAIQLNSQSIQALEKDLKNVGLSFEKRKQVASELADLEIKNAEITKQKAQEILDAELLKTKGASLQGEKKAEIYRLETEVIAAENSKQIAIQERSKRISLLLKGEEIADKSEQIAKAAAAELKAKEDLDNKLQKEADDNRNALKEFYLKSIADNEKADKAANDKRLEDQNTAFNNEISLINERADLERTVAQNTITDKKELAAAEEKIALKTLQFQLAALQTYSDASGVMTEQQSIALQKLEEQIKHLKNELVNEDNVTLGNSIGLTDEELSKASEVLGQIQSGVAAVQGVVEAGYQTQLNNLEGLHNAEIENINNSILSEEEKRTKITAVNKKYAKDKYEIEKKAFEANKAFQIVNVIIAGALGIVQALAQLGPIAGAIAAVLVGVTTAAQVGVISSQSPPAAPTFEKGGVVKAARGATFGRFAGRSHSEGGNKYVGEDGSVIEVERDEIFAVVNKRSSAMIKNLSDLNQLGGGVAFEKGGLVKRFAGGGQINSISNDALQQSDNTRNLAAQLSSIVPVLVLEDFESVQGRKVKTILNLQI